MLAGISSHWTSTSSSWLPVATATTAGIAGAGSAGISGASGLWATQVSAQRQASSRIRLMYCCRSATEIAPRASSRLKVCDVAMH